jgi:hypothetical protein
MTQIKAAQDEILADYAGGCMIDVETCLGKNNYGTSNGTYSNAAINACRSQIVTCMSVNGDATKEPNPAAIKAWIEAAYNNKETENPAEPEEPEVTCKKYTLNDNGGTGGTGTIYKKDKSITIYTDSNCTTSISAVNIPTKSGYTFNGYKTSSNIACITSTGFMSGACSDLPSDNDWDAQWIKQSNCIKINLEARSLPNNNVAPSSKLTQDSIYYNNGLFLDSNCSTSLTDAYKFITSNDVDSYAGVYSADSTASTLCITGDAAADYQNNKDCQPKSTTTWYVYFDDLANK